MRSRHRNPAPEAPLLRGIDALSPGDASASQWLVWQLVDSAFPTGGFAHSLGLEAAAQHGEVRGRDELMAFVEASLDQLGNGTLPFVLAAYDDREEIPDLDRLCEVFTINHVANRASRAQGRALLAAVDRIFPLTGNLEGQIVWPFGHFAPVFGACLRRLEISRETAGRMYFFNYLRSVLAAAVRLNIVGPMEAQVLLRRLSPVAETVFQSCVSLTVREIAQTAPLLDLWQGAQDRLYSRLFQS